MHCSPKLPDRRRSALADQLTDSGRQPNGRSGLDRCRSSPEGQYPTLHLSLTWRYWASQPRPQEPFEGEP